jgi:hypothetical protein
MISRVVSTEICTQHTCGKQTKPENSGYDYGRMRPATPLDSRHYQQKIPDPVEGTGGGVYKVIKHTATEFLHFALMLTR